MGQVRLTASVTAFTGTATQINTALGDMGADPTDFDSTLSSGVPLPVRSQRLRAMMGQVRLTGLQQRLRVVSQRSTRHLQRWVLIRRTLTVRWASSEAASAISTLANDGTGAINGVCNNAYRYGDADQHCSGDMGTDPTNFNSTLSAGSASASAISTLAAMMGQVRLTAVL